jgi:hypothetical protein
MKNIMTLMLGTALALGCVSATFAQDPPKKEKTKKPPKSKKTKKSAEPKKG